MRLYFAKSFIFGLGLFSMAVGVALLSAAAAWAEPESPIPTFTDNGCLSCHTDKQQLTELAVVEAEPEEASLSSGPG